MDSTTLPRWLYTADQVKQGEVLAAKRANIALYQLMERARARDFDAYSALIS